MVIVAEVPSQTTGVLVANVAVGRAFTVRVALWPVMVSEQGGVLLLTTVVNAYVYVASTVCTGIVNVPVPSARMVIGVV